MKHIVHEVKLKNGAKGLLIDVPDATVFSTSFHFLAGNRYVKEKKIEQTAHLMEHMAFGANKKFKDSHKFDAEFTKNGAYNNAFTGGYAMRYVAECADFEWDRILGLQELSITQPLFQEDDLKSESGNVRNELTGYTNNRGRILWGRMSQEIGVDAITDEESLATVENITLADVKEHHKRTHTLKNMRFVIAGQLDVSRRKKIIESLEKWQLPEGERFAIPRDELHSASPLFIKRAEDKNILFDLMLLLPQRLAIEEVDAMNALNHILNGTLHSRIQGAARKKGLAYGVWSGIDIDEYDSSWSFSAEANLNTVEPLFDIIVRELKRVKDGEVSDADLDEAKQYRLGKHQMGAQTVGAIANWYARDYFFDESIYDIEKMPENVARITKERIVETAKKFFDADLWVLGGIGKGNTSLIQALHGKTKKLF